jgi:tetratricopeptide (TPR) repeat protein
MLSRILVPVGGLLFGVAIIVAVELVLAAFGVGDDAPLHDPFAGFSSAVPMFEIVDAETDAPIYRISPAREGTPHLLEPEPQREFLARKPPDEFRIFVVGGSSSQGVPYSTNYAFSSWLERRLDASLPDLDVKVVNAGLSGYASRRVVPIVEEIAGYEPDAVVVYMGHNEWAETMYYEHLLDLDPRLFRALEWAYKTRIYALASRILDLEAFQRAPELDVDFKTNTNQMFGVLRDRAAGTSHPTERELAFRDILYEHNLLSVTRTIKRAGAAPVLLTLSQNLSDWPPPASSHRPDLSEDELELWQAHAARGDALAESGDCTAALEAHASALGIDDQFADLHYRVANCHRKRGENVLALAHYRLASDLDRVPHGANSRFNDVIRRVAREEDVLFVDTDTSLVAESGDGLMGYDLFTDFAHPNVRAHQHIAATVSEAMRAAGLPRASAEWQEGYEDPPLAQLYQVEPRLETLELQSRVFLCILAPRDSCAAEAAKLSERDPGNTVARKVLKDLGVIADG